MAGLGGLGALGAVPGGYMEGANAAFDFNKKLQDKQDEGLAGEALMSLQSSSAQYGPGPGGGRSNSSLRVPDSRRLLPSSHSSRHRPGQGTGAAMASSRRSSSLLPAVGSSLHSNDHLSSPSSRRRSNSSRRHSNSRHSSSPMAGSISSSRRKGA